MKKKLQRIVVILLLFSYFPFSLMAEEQKTDSDSTQWPQWSKDLRRTEIITFGSLPFVTLWTTLGYSIAVYGEFRNPLSKNTDSFTTDDQKRIIAASAGISLGLGVFDLVMTIIKRKSEKRSEKNIQEAITVEVPSSEEQPFSKSDYLIEGVVEDAVF